MIPPNFGLQSGFFFEKLLADSSQMTVSWWENPLAESAITQLSTSLSTGTGTRAIYFADTAQAALYRLQPGRVALCARSVGGVYSAVYSLAGYQLIGSEHHYAITLDVATGDTRFYRDSIQHSQSSWPGLLGATFWIGASTGRFFVNCHNGGVNNSYLGELRIYRRALTSDEVYQIFAFRGGDRVYNGLAARVCCAWTSDVRQAGAPIPHTGTTYHYPMTASEELYRYAGSGYTDMIHEPDTIRTRPRHRRK